MLLFWLACLLVLGLDQWSKYWAVTHLSHPVPLAGGLITLRCVRNPGAAFGLMAHQNFWLITIALLAIAALIWGYRRLPSLPAPVRLGLGLFLGGTLGNLLDRLRGGCVVDFIDLGWWPVFNLADVAILVGVVLVLWYWWGRET
ncbi:signal peptidase II [Desulfothermobacter acidiphilus]|uniref:signal peptidase II n=1 Tax=Desulfothermobacter acidiphilus TaxID=1938353 RepID=UPI003F8C3521